MTCLLKSIVSGKSDSECKFLNSPKFGFYTRNYISETWKKSNLL